MHNRKNIKLSGISIVLLFLAFLYLSKGAAYSAPGRLPVSPEHGKRIIVGGIEFVFIAGGTFNMGSPESAGYRNERPRHMIRVNSFWIGRYEVTQRQYYSITGKNPSNFRGQTRPVEQVSWHDAAEFSKNFSAKHQLKVRLPYEAEWEYAARAGTSTGYSWGDKMKNAYAWYNVNSGDSTHPVGRKRANRWGIYDMSGNVFEWCIDYYSDRFYEKSGKENPTGPSEGRSRVVRGGSWHNNLYNVRSAFRVPFRPESAHFYHGFRLLIPAGQ